jgi:hypothetical protein
MNNQAKEMTSSKGLKLEMVKKQFCTPMCEAKYNASFSKTCSLESCSKSFVKENGVLEHARWFCSHEHA